MNFVSLMIHGLSGLFANQEIVGTRLLVGISGSVILLITAIMAILAVRIGSALSIPGWAVIAIGILLILVFQAITACGIVIFSIMTNRNNLGFLPMRDFPYFVRDHFELFPSSAGAAATDEPLVAASRAD